MEIACNICGKQPEFSILLTITKDGEESDDNAFYLCEEHEFVYKRMQKGMISIERYFPETLEAMQ